MYRKKLSEHSRRAAAAQRGEREEEKERKREERKAERAKKLFNKVVTVEGRPGRFYFVLTYIPDLFWCRLAPLAQRGVFPAGATRRAWGKKKAASSRTVSPVPPGAGAGATAGAAAAAAAAAASGTAAAAASGTAASGAAATAAAATGATAEAAGAPKSQRTSIAGKKRWMLVPPHGELEANAQSSGSPVAAMATATPPPPTTYAAITTYAGPPWQGEGEIDVSARRVTVVRSIAVRKTKDADREEFIIPQTDEPPKPPKAKTKAKAKARKARPEAGIKGGAGEGMDDMALSSSQGHGEDDGLGNGGYPGFTDVIVECV